MREENYINVSKIYKRRRRTNMFDEILNEINERKKNNKEYAPMEMESICNRILNEIGKGSDIENQPIPIVKIAKEMGFKVFQQKMESELSGFIAVNNDYEEKLGSNRIISVNLNDEIGHQRFVIAHELAHYLFDYIGGEQQKVYYNTYFKDSHDTVSEVRANQFAANLLMPKTRFSRELNEKDIIDANAIQKLKDSFQVQEKAVFKRIYEV